MNFIDRIITDISWNLWISRRIILNKKLFLHLDNSSEIRKSVKMIELIQREENSSNIFLFGFQYFGDETRHTYI